LKVMTTGATVEPPLRLFSALKTGLFSSP